MPKFEKVDDNTIRIIVEKADEVPLARLIETRKQIVEQRDNMNKTLKNIDEILTEAKKLGITPKLKDNKPKKWL